VVMWKSACCALSTCAELFQLVATFGVSLVIQESDADEMGAEDNDGPRAPA